MPQVTSETSAENFDDFKEEEPFFSDEENGAAGATGGVYSKYRKPRKLDMNFIGYTYKADVENERSMLVNVLKDLD